VVQKGVWGIVVRWRLPLLLVFIVALLPTLANQPLYFITDDIAWLSWAQSSQGDALNFMSDAPGTGYRPLINFIWFYGYALFGASGLAFQLINALFFALAAVFVYRLGKLLGGEVAGLIAAILFIALDTSYVIVYWSAYLTTTVEMFFMVAALFYIIRAWERRSASADGEPPHSAARVTAPASDFWERLDPVRRYWMAGLVVGLVFALLAYLSKEMSLVLIPLGLLAYAIFSYGRLKVPRAVLLGVPVVLGAISLFMLLTLYPIAEQAGGGGLGQAGESLPYYLNMLFTIELTAPLLVAGCGYLVVRRIPPGSTRTLARIVLLALFIFAIAAPTSMSLLESSVTDASGTPVEPYRVFNAFSILILLAILAALVAGDHRERTGVVWFLGGFGLLLFLGLEPQATYMHEPLIGLCLVLGFAYRDFAAELVNYVADGTPRLFTVRGVVRGAVYIALVLAVLSQVAFAAYWAGAANSYGSDLVDLEDNFREVMEDLADSLPVNSTLFGYEYNASLFPTLYYGRTYHIASMESMLSVLGRQDVSVLPISSIINETDITQHRGEKFVITYVLYFEKVHKHPDIIETYQQYAQGLVPADDVFDRVLDNFQTMSLDELWILKLSDPEFYTYIESTWPVEEYTNRRNTILIYTIA